MTRKEIEWVIKHNERRIARLKNQITDIRFDIKATRDSIRFWKAELKKAKD